MKPIIAKRLLTIIYIVGVLGFIFEQTQNLMQSLTASTILFSAVFLLFYHNDWSIGFLVSGILIASTGFLIEYIGIETGLVFGRYIYGNTLGLKLLNVPILIGLNWFVLVYCSRNISQFITKNKWMQIILGSLLMTAYDYALEPFAQKYDLWTWNSGTIPIHNFIGWFLVSIVIHSVYINSKKQNPNPIASFLFLVQLLFFAIIGFYHQIFPYTPL